MSVNDLSSLLWRERELLEMLVFKLGTHGYESVAAEDDTFIQKAAVL